MAGVLITSAPVLAQQTGGGMSDDRPIYGRQLMTQQEMEHYRERMRSAESEEERRRIRAEHHAEMQGRARERGVQLPEKPGYGMGGKGMHGQGMGQGMGSGGGSGMGDERRKGGGRQ
ncbi:hypothetical protein [Ferruginivarius sediminum]|uniref:hypothetical protein n=1 Tax=Ferruginivarius sediminum TaxID=2661937 RepID=UPI0019D45144|nr:hypothetical protein [Ferruginivarius sediminum]